MKKLAVLNSFAAWLILSVALMLFSGPAQAYVYDGFTSEWINQSLWHKTPNSGLFDQPGDGYLYFKDTSGGQTDILTSFNPVSGAFFVSMQYSNFQANNNQPPGFAASAVQLGLSYGGNAVTAFEAKNDSGQFFQAVSNIGGVKTHLDPPIFSNVNSGWLGIGYNGKLGSGGQVTFWYDAGAGWTEIAAYAPNFSLFSQAPHFWIQGSDNYGTSLSFQVDQVQLTSTPVPPSVLLLGSGLLGLAGWRRFRKG